MKKIIGVVLFLCLAVLLVGCGNKKIPYNAKIYDWNDMVIDDEVLLNNKVKNADYIVRNEDGTIDVVTDENAPIDRTVIIEDETTFKSYIRENYLTVDFTKQTVLVYFYLTYYEGRDLYISKIDYKNGNVKVDFYDKYTGKKDNSGPCPGYAVIVLDKLELKDCTFTYTSKNK